MVAIGQCRSGGITVATVAPAHGMDNVIPDSEDSGGPPLPHWDYLIWASKKKPECSDDPIYIETCYLRDQIIIAA